MYIKGEIFVLCTFKFQLTCVSSVMAFHQNYSCSACFKGAILGETRGNSVLCLNDNKNCIGFCSCGQNDPKDFLKTEEIVREPCSGKDNAKIFTGMVSVGPAGHRVLRFQPWPGWMGSTGNFSCALAGHRNLRGRTFLYPQTTSHLSTVWLSQKEM